MNSGEEFHGPGGVMEREEMGKWEGELGAIYRTEGRGKKGRRSPDLMAVAQSPASMISGQRRRKVAWA